MHRYCTIALLLLLQVLTFVYGNNYSIQENDEAATLIIYVKPGLKLTSFVLHINDQEIIANFSKNTYYKIIHPPGKISLKTDGKLMRNLIEERAYSLTLEAGATYYLEAMMEYQVLMTSMHLLKRSPEVGEKEIVKMNEELINLINP